MEEYVQKQGTVRTDLAVEARESICRGQDDIHGIQADEYDYDDCDVHVTRVTINTKNAARIMDRPMGVYITMEAPFMPEPDEGYHREISECIALELGKLLPDTVKGGNILVVGLGNRAVTADALGPFVVDQLYIDRHIVREYGASGASSGEYLVSALEPGVMGRTGMETAEIVKGVVEQTEPVAVIAIDALAARSTRRLHRTIQLASTGIQPGSGVGNHRSALTLESLGVPVIALGVPTVVDAATIVMDVLGHAGREEHRVYSGKHIPGLTELHNMYMTGKDIDAVIRRISFTVSEGINIAMRKNS